MLFSFSPRGARGVSDFASCRQGGGGEVDDEEDRPAGVDGEKIETTRNDTRRHRRGSEASQGPSSGHGCPNTARSPQESALDRARLGQARSRPRNFLYCRRLKVRASYGPRFAVESPPSLQSPSRPLSPDCVYFPRSISGVPRLIIRFFF